VQLIKQRNLRDCAVCAVAMLADLPYERVLADNPNYEGQRDQEWIDYLRSLGFHVRRTALLGRGHRYFCIAAWETESDPSKTHAIAVDEKNSVYDPSSGAPEPGVLTVDWYKASPRRLSYIHVINR
jgi:hypothetical protein